MTAAARRGSHPPLPGLIGGGVKLEACLTVEVGVGDRRVARTLLTLPLHSAAPTSRLRLAVEAPTGPKSGWRWTSRG